MNKILITGARGFIGSALTKRLLERENTVIAVDKFKPRGFGDDGQSERYAYYGTDVREHGPIVRIMNEERPDTVVHLAGRTGMRASMAEPDDFFSLNVTGTQSVLEACRKAHVTNFILASSVAVYGEAFRPVVEDQPLPPPANPYAVTKVIGELLARNYSDVYEINMTVLRIFSVFGPGQRPETAVFKFTEHIACGRPVPVYGDGSAQRDYLYIDNCIQGIEKAIDRPFRYEVFNIGEQRTITVRELVLLLAEKLGKPAVTECVPVPNGLPAATYADISKAKGLLSYDPAIGLEEGLTRFIKWYKTIKS